MVNYILVNAKRLQIKFWVVFMIAVIIDAFVDTLKMVPLMLIVFTVIEFLEHRFGNSLKPLIKRSHSWGPFLGALFGILPQCGFSVISTVLFAEGAISTGTLLSVYLSTSDEAIPIILSVPSRAGVLLPLILTKFIIAVISGYSIDLVLKFIKKENSTVSNEEHVHGVYDEDGCCGHVCIDEDFNLKEIIMHSIEHTFKILLYVLCVTIMLNIAIYYIGQDNISKVFPGRNVLQPVIASLVGLIPNCAASVAITEVFLKGGITFGSAIAGLSSSAGLGLIVLFREIHSRKRILSIIALLLIFSIASGIILNLMLPVNFASAVR